MDNIQKKLREIISQGLVSGLGEPQPGLLCVEAAICLALGEPHSDRPSCVAEKDRAYAIAINDATWSSPEARARALLPLALAQLGTAGTDRSEWVRRLVEGTIQRVLPIALRAAAKVATGEHSSRLASAADRCERDGDRAAARAAARAADAAYAAADARAAAYAADAARATDAAYAAAAYAHAYAVGAAAAYAAAAARAAAHAAGAAAADEVLRASVQVAIDAYSAEEPR